MTANGTLFTDAQKLMIISYYSNLLRNHPYTYYKIKAIQFLTGSNIGSFGMFFIRK